MLNEISTGLQNFEMQQRQPDLTSEQKAQLMINNPSGPSWMNGNHSAPSSQLDIDNQKDRMRSSFLGHMKQESYKKEQGQYPYDRADKTLNEINEQDIKKDEIRLKN